MKKQISLVILTLFLIFQVSNAGAAQRVVIYGDDAYPPYSFKQNGTLDGIYVRILETAFSRMKDYVVEIRLVPWKRAMLGLKTGDIFAAFPPYYRTQKRPWIDIYSTPILEENYTVYCRRKVMARQRKLWPEDFKDLQIGINDGFLIPEVDKLKLQEASSNEKNLRKLLAGRIDCYVNDSNSVKYTAIKEKINLEQFTEAARLSKEFGHLAFSAENNPPFKRDFIYHLNRIIKEMHDNGEIKRIVHDFLQ